MHKLFDSLDALFAHIHEDKQWQGVNSGQYNRYPIRFVLFDNFADFNEFINNRPEGIFNFKLDSLLEKDYPDTFVTYSALAQDIKRTVTKLPARDFVIFPFSEMARFYRPEEFESLIKSIRLKQPPEDSQAEHIRLYIPIVGMQHKMSPFFGDNQTFVWEYKGTGDPGRYRLIVTRGTTYGVTGLERDHSVVSDLAHWLMLWNKGEGVKHDIVCSSPSIFDNVRYAQPDNAFTYVECHSAFEFLTRGLGLDFGIDEEPTSDENKHWERLASMIDVTTFDFDTMVNERFDTFSLHDSMDFIKAWDDCDDEFDRWLLTLYFKKISQGEGYVNLAISKCANLSTSELFSHIATAIFDTAMTPAAIAERRQAMQLATSRNVKLTEMAEGRLSAKLRAIAANPGQGMYVVKQLLTSLSASERRLMVEWVGSGQLQASEIRDIFPDLYHYIKPMALSQPGEASEWINGYFDAYRTSKLGNSLSDEVTHTIASRNADAAAFINWRDNIKTVRTILHNRHDIDVIYWIDGLGVDWIPFIMHVIGEHARENVYLNEVYVATAALPTTTSVNKPILQSLASDGDPLRKIGDLDTFAHTHKPHPQYIIDEMAIVRESIESVLEQYNGKKIAFVSDHGITYLAQYASGLVIAGLTGDHEGRVATHAGTIVDDKSYVKLDDGHTVCALSHHSLTDKVDKGHGAHGGCTPEEVLVPIIIVSSQKNATNYAVRIINDEIDGTRPIVEFEIKGLNTVDTPVLEYNGVNYRLTATGGDTFASERLNLVDTATRVTVKIGDSFKSSHTIHVSTGATEDDLFDF